MQKKTTKLILFVEKQTFPIQKKKEFLEKKGFQVLFTDSSAKAIQLAHSKPDIILMDSELGEKKESVKTAKQILQINNVPILFQISPKSSLEINDILHYGYVSKSASLEILESSIKNALHLFATQQKQDKKLKELLANQNLYRLLMTNVQEGVILVDTNDKILFVNNHFCNSVGYKKEELIGKIGYKLLVAEPERKKLLQHNASRLQGISEQYELTMIKKSGEPIIFFMNASPVYDEQGNFTGSMATCLDITKRKQAEEKAHESEKMLRLILDTLPVSVFIKDRNLRYLDCNLAFARDAGLRTTQEIIGKSDNDLLWKEQAELYRTIGKKVMRTKQKQLNIEEPQIFPTGEKRWVKTNLIPLLSKQGECFGVLGTYEDITERIDAQNKLRQSEITYRGIMNSIEEAIYIQDENGTFLDVNTSVEDFYDYPKEYVIGKTPEFLSAEGKNNLPDIAKAVKKAYHGEPQHFEFWAQRKDGTIFPKEVSLSAGSYFGKKAVIAVARNITERKDKENQILTLLKEKETLLQEVHHRIKNNMNIICSLLSLQMKSTDSPQVIAALQDAQSRVQSMMILYDKLYRTTHFKTISSQEFFSSLVDEILSIFPNHTFIKVIKEFDEFKLEERKISALGIILGELLTNAMKYAFRGKQNGCLKIVSKAKDKQVFLVIQDDGNGLPDNLDINHSEGFGLKLVHLLVRQINGTISCRRLYPGTQFTIQFQQ